MTHEETVTFHAREIRSYRELPQMLYHFQTKVRDEPRPRGGLLRVREFVMKDAYSFDRDEEGLERSFRLQEQAYHKIFERCGLEVVAVQAESGMMGGSASVDFLAPSGSGENTLVTCENGDYAADLEIARGVPRAPEFPAALDAPEEIETPGVTTIEGLAEFLGIDAAATSKAMPVVNGDGTLVLALVRGDDRLDEAKLAVAVGAGIRPAAEEEIEEAFGARAGSIGPVGFEGQVIADETLREGQFVTGANRTGRHLRGVEHGRDFQASFADIRQPREGDACMNCGGALRFQDTVEVGHIFKLETKYSGPLGARFLDEDGKEKPIFMGSYGIGPGRVMAAAVEQNNDEAGIAGWPPSIAPYDAHVVVLPGLEDEGERVAAELEAEGLDLLVDDRDQRAGEKFADADLIGCPVRLTVGKKTLEDGAVDLVRRADRSEDRVKLGKIGSRVKELVGHGS
jgi:prolyl-tRNA synthetase